MLTPGSRVKSHGGVQGVYTHQSTTCACPMTFAVFVPPHELGTRLPVLWYLSGLTCSHANVMEKGEYRAAAARHGIIIVCPDTSPRGPAVADVADNWKLGQGASFYVDATQAPWNAHYQMYSYITQELPALVAAHFPIDPERQSIFGHSMGGHGALVMALKNPGRWRSCSAFAPIVAPMTAPWSRPALEAYLGPDETVLRQWDAVALVQDGAKAGEILIDQGMEDSFLQDGLKPWLLEEACRKSGQTGLTLRMQPGYDHSYYFISSFMADHIAWHSQRLKG